MLGKLLGAAINVAVFPVKVAEATFAATVGETRKELKDAMPCPTNLTDKIVESLKEIDEEN